MKISAKKIIFFWGFIILIFKSFNIRRFLVGRFDY